MDKSLIAKASISIKASNHDVWNALVNPHDIKQYSLAPTWFLTGVKEVRLSGKESGRANRMKIKG